MFHENRAAGALGEQRPGDLWRRLKHGMDESGGFFEGGEGEQEGVPQLNVMARTA